MALDVLEVSLCAHFFHAMTLWNGCDVRMLNVRGETGNVWVADTSGIAM